MPAASANDYMVLLQKANHKGGLTEAEEKVWANIVETDMSAKKYRKTFRHAGQKTAIRHGQLQKQFMRWINGELYRNSVLANNLNEDDSAEIRKHLANLHFQVLQSDKYDATFIK